MGAARTSRRVGYILSSSLLGTSDLLPSNPGRSTLVHSLNYHLDLLDLSDLDDGSSPHSLAKNRAGTSEYERLLAKLGSDVKSDGERDESMGNRAKVYAPKRAKGEEIEVYHDAKFVRALFGGKEEGESGSDEEEEVGEEEGEEEEEEAIQLRPTSNGGTKRKRYSGPPPRRKNQFGLLDDCPAFPGLRNYVELVAGGSIRAAELAAMDEVDVAIAWDGGRHHAKKDAASGFCYVNDVVLAILALRKLRKRKVLVVDDEDKDAVKKTVEHRGSTGTHEEPASPPTPPPRRYKTISTRMDRILYLDLDLHWGDGVEEAFYTSSSVLTLSLHHFAPGFFPCYQTAPLTGAGGKRYGPPGSLNCQGGPSTSAAASKALSLPLLPGANGESLLRVLRSNVESVVEAFRPECIIVQLGLDGLAGDPMATWNLDAKSILAALSLILSWTSMEADEHGGKCKLLVLGGGGYHNANAARVWSIVTAFLLGRYREGVGEEGKVGLETAVPESCPTWPEMGGGTLDVGAGEMVDTNDQEHFEKVDEVFREHVKVLVQDAKKTTAI